MSNEKSLVPATQVVAADLLKGEHPLRVTFVASLDGKEATKRQARKFLAEHPEYRTPKEA